jgi:hypothetical protein
VYHIVLILLTGALLFMSWHLVHASPSVLGRILPSGLTFGIGIFIFIFGTFIAYCSAYGGDPGGVLGSFVQVIVGLWFMLSTTSGMRGSDGDERMLKRLFIMIGLVMAMMIGMLYMPNPYYVSVLDLLLVTGGFWVVMNYFRDLDRGR